MDTEKIRQDFPILKSGVIYFDNGASSLTPEPVLSEMDNYYRQYRANIHRGLHRLSQKASEKYREAQEHISRFFNCREEEFVATYNTTMSLNALANGIDFKGGKIVTSKGEHHSNILPWQKLEKEGRARLEYINLKPDGTLDLEHVKQVIDQETRLVSLVHVSNVSGVINPVEEVAKIAHAQGALFAVDGAQSAGHLPVDFKRLGCDFYAFSSHKMLGPTGVGGLIIRQEIEDQLTPFCPGGGTVSDVDLHSCKWVKPPEKYEGGTPNIAGVIGLGRAVEYLSSIGMKNIEQHQKMLVKETLKGFAGIKNLTLYGPQERAPVMSFNIKGLNFHDISGILDETAKICTRSGAHCCIPLMKHFGVEGTVRASYHLYNTQQEVTKFTETLKGIAETLA